MSKPNGYTYKIGWSAYDKFYYGVRTANIVAPTQDLWIKYFTSSTVVKSFRKEVGEPDIIIIDKEFKHNDDALLYETNYIKTNSLHTNEQWLNQSYWPTKSCAGIPKTAEQKAHLSKVMKGRKKPSRSKEHCQKIRERMQGQIPWNKGIPEDPLVTKRRSILLTGRTMTAESSRKKSEKLKGRKSPNLGNKWKMTNEQIQRRQKSRKRNAAIKGRTY